nr:hypothetical protein [Burkholderiaceae bacterium]
MRSASTPSADAGALQHAGGPAPAARLVDAANLLRGVFALALAICALLPAGYLLLTALPILFEGGWLAHF